MHLQNSTQRWLSSAIHSQLTSLTRTFLFSCLPLPVHSRYLLLSKPSRPFPFLPFLRISPRPISIRQLNALLHLHPGPIYLVVFKGSYFLKMAYLILRGASRLDAFSVYPFRTWLPCRAFGNTTGTPAVRPSRSSRTKDSSSQISYACAG